MSFLGIRLKGGWTCLLKLRYRTKQNTKLSQDSNVILLINRELLLYKWECPAWKVVHRQACAPHLQNQDGERDLRLAEILPQDKSQPPLLGFSEHQGDSPDLTLQLTIYPVPGRRNSSTITKINLWEKAIQTSELLRGWEKNNFLSKYK